MDVRKSPDRRKDEKLKNYDQYKNHCLREEHQKKRRSSSRNVRSRSKKKHVKNEHNRSISNDSRYDTLERKLKRITKSRSAEHRKNTKNSWESSEKQSPLKEKKSKRKKKSRSRDESHKKLSNSRERCSYRERSKNKREFISKSRERSGSTKRKFWSKHRSRDRSYSHKRRSQKIDQNHESYSDKKIKDKLSDKNGYNYDEYNYKYDKKEQNQNNHWKKEKDDSFGKEINEKNLKGYAEELFGSQREHIRELIKNNNQKISSKSSMETNNLIPSIEFVKSNPKTLTNEITNQSNSNFETDLKSRHFSHRPNGFNDILPAQGSAPPNMTFSNLKQPPPSFYQSQNPPIIQQLFHHQPPPPIQQQASFLDQAPSKHLFKTLHRPEIPAITQTPPIFSLHSEHLRSFKNQILTSYHSDSNPNINLLYPSQQHTHHQLITHPITPQQHISQQHTQHQQHTFQQQILQQNIHQPNFSQHHTQQNQIPPKQLQHHLQQPSNLVNSSLYDPYSPLSLNNANMKSFQTSDYTNNNKQFIPLPPKVLLKPVINIDNNQSLPPPPPPPQKNLSQPKNPNITNINNHIGEDKLNEGVSGSYSPYSSTSEGSAYDCFSNNLFEDSSSNINTHTPEVKLKNGMKDEQVINSIKNVHNDLPSSNLSHSTGNNIIKNGSDHLVSLAKNLDLSASMGIHFNDLKKVLETANSVTSNQNSHNHSNQISHGHSNKSSHNHSNQISHGHSNQISHGHSNQISHKHSNQSKVVTTTKTSKERKIDQVVEEVKSALRPHFSCSLINKEEYKNIMRKAVPKIMSSKSDLKSDRVKNFIQLYVNKVLVSKKIHRIRSKKVKT